LKKFFVVVMAVKKVFLNIKTMRLFLRKVAIFTFIGRRTNVSPGVVRGRVLLLMLRVIHSWTASAITTADSCTSQETGGSLGSHATADS
jgi:hypothetical protein